MPKLKNENKIRLAIDLFKIAVVLVAVIGSYYRLKSDVRDLETRLVALQKQIDDQADLVQMIMPLDTRINTLEKFADRMERLHLHGIHP